MNKIECWLPRESITTQKKNKTNLWWVCFDIGFTGLSFPCICVYHFVVSLLLFFLFHNIYCLTLNSGRLSTHNFSNVINVLYILFVIVFAYIKSNWFLIILKNFFGKKKKTLNTDSEWLNQFNDWKTTTTNICYSKKKERKKHRIHLKRIVWAVTITVVNDKNSIFFLYAPRESSGKY